MSRKGGWFPNRMPSRVKSYLYMQKKLNPDLWYPYSYHREVPSVMLQGWHDVKLAKYMYRRVYGKNYSDDNLFWVKGSKIYLGQYILGNVWIGNRWTQYTKSLIWSPSETRSTFVPTHILEIMTRNLSDKGTKMGERIFMKRLEFMYYERDVQKVEWAQITELQEVKKAIQERKETLFIPD